MALPLLIRASLAFFAALAFANEPPPVRESKTSQQQATDELRSLPYASPITGANVQTGLIVDSRFASPGYNFYADRFNNTAALITNDGRTVHTWEHRNSSSWGHVEPLPSGELLVIETWDAFKKPQYPAEKGFPSRIVKLSADSKPEWISRIPAHHDIQLLGDGTFLTLTERRRHLADVDSKHVTLDNGIARVDRNGKLLNEVSLYRVFVRSGKRLKTIAPDGRGLIDLFHANSIQRFDTSSGAKSGTVLYASGNTLFCSRHQDLIGIISVDGRLLWSWGENELSGPHAARLLDNGNILVFDNGLGRNASRIIEIDPRTNHIAWTYQSEKPADFYSGTGGYAQRLANGNTLITNSWTYTAFEVTSEGRLVWKFVNPQKSFIYRFNRYPGKYFNDTLQQEMSAPGG